MPYKVGEGMEIFKLFGTIMVEDKAAMKSLQKVDKEGNKLAQGFSKVGKIIAGAFSVAAIAKFGKKLIETSASLQAMEAQFDQVFKEDNAQAVERINKQVDDLGIHADRLTTSWNKFGGQVKGAGMDSEKALAATDKATRLAADAAAYFDTSLESASASLASFMKGNFSAGDAIGVFTSAKQMDGKANEMYGKSWKDLTEAERQWLLLDTVEKTYELNGAMGQAAREADAYENVMGNLKATFDRLWATMGEPVLEIFLIGVQKVTTGVEWLQEKIETLDWSVFDRGKEIIKNLYDRAVDWFKGLEDNFNNIREGILNIWNDTIYPFVQNIIEMGKELYEENKDKINLIIELFKALIQFIEERIYPVIKGIVNVVKENLDTIKSIIQSAIDIISGIIKVFIGLFTADWETMKEGIVQIWNSLWEGLRNIVAGAWNLLSGAFDVVWNAIKRWFDDLVEDFTGWGGDLIRGLWNGISGLVDWLYEKITGFAEGIANTFKRFFGIESPSKLMEGYGKNIDEGLAEGIIKNENIPLDAITKVGEKMADAASNAAKTVMDLLTISEDSVTIGNVVYGKKSTSKRAKERKEKDYAEHKDEIYAISERQGVDLSTAYEMWKTNEREKLLGKTPQYALGTMFHKGGYAIVGERGPELVELPTGSRVYDNNKTEEIIKPKSIVQNITINSPSPLTPSEVARQLKNASRELAMGV